MSEKTIHDILAQFREEALNNRQFGGVLRTPDPALSPDAPLFAALGNAKISSDLIISTTYKWGSNAEKRHTPIPPSPLIACAFRTYTSPNV